jgi:hypothetical protein
MILRAKKCFAWAFTALFAFLAVFGEALHIVPGSDHHCAVPHTAGVPAHHDCTTVVRGHCCDGPTLSAAEQDQHISCADTCPICHYFTQARCFLIVDEFVSESLPIYVRFIAPPLIFSRHTHWAYQSRGPPAAYLWLS